ncbi:translation elongation factor Ts [Micavibrio aeruginosavorus]|uniref:Elongation factor Ts n=2 Tax=Micavibrio aeruginosavorus TaxID=349221 RepID=G2KSR0_MICAA|nr:translation elongation factor Ts [Micavibrio aeruginosavorus]AEP09660.1 translation elongation factor Ts [Micavibrio aeruginosavorus ARL-13]AGH98083.1 Translation elongation factor Ts [Micavibrio aeruginosavorus EPB]
MADITASMVKELREKSGAGMMDAKQALVENNGDIEAAMDWLRTKGLSKAAKKSGRTTAEGLVAVVAEGTSAAIVEVNAETDFVARNDQFQALVRNVAKAALKGAGKVEEVAEVVIEGGKSVKDTLTTLIATIGENMSLRRSAKLAVNDGIVATYVHNAIGDGLGKIGVLVALESTGDKAKLEALGKQIAMHVAAANPAYLDSSSVDPDVLEREKNVIRETAKEQGKAADIIEKMLEGRVRKYYEEVCLIEQIFIMDGETKISKVIENASKDVGAPVKLAGFARFQLGEGIEKEETDFAAEVAKVVNG